MIVTGQTARQATAHACPRRLPVGAEPQPGGGVHFRVWAPRRSRVAVVTLTHEQPKTTELEAEEHGYFSRVVESAGAGTRYAFCLDGDDRRVPDPVSRFQPEGPHGLSMVIDPLAFQWGDHDWQGIALPGQVIYEMHIGTVTREGTLAAAARQLDALGALGVTVIELMPVAEFAGRFGWGYDGVDLFAPNHLYGEPDDLRRFVDRAHRLGLGVFLDVVYNHLGPDGNYLKEFSCDYFTDRHTIAWGEAISFDGPSAGPVREFVLANAAYWIGEFHFDGLRLDATDAIFDGSREHILTAIGRAVREAAGHRRSIVVAENEAQDARLIRPAARQGYGLDAVWNDDFHHAAMVALTGRREAYYGDYRGTPQELISAVRHGYLFQGQRHRWLKKRRGTPTSGTTPTSFVHFLQNHDQVANSARGLRAHRLTTPGRWRAMTALLLLGPETPHAVSGPGVLGLEPIPLLCRSQEPHPGSCPAGPQRLPRAVPKCGCLRGGEHARSRRSGCLRAVQAGCD